MRSAPHPDGVVRDEDIELVLERFEEEFARSAIINKLVLDTTESTPEETLEEFLCKMEPYWTEGDRLLMLTHAL